MTPVRKYRKNYLPSEYQIPSTHLTFEIYDGYTIVHSTLYVQRTNPYATALTLHGEGLELISLRAGETDITDTIVDAHSLSIPWIYGDEVMLHIENKIYPETNTHLEGLYFASGLYCTQCEPEGFRRITYSIDRPDVMSRFHVRIEASNKYPILLSNGNKISEGELDGGRHFTEWDDPFLKPTYLFALVAADLDRTEDIFTTMSGREVGLYILVDHGKSAEALHAMESLKRAMKWDEETYGREYDLDVFHIVATDSFNMGAMENKSLNIFNSMFVLASHEKSIDTDFLDVESVIGHEYFHNWTGNRITCRDWFQLTLKEGLTVYRDQTFSGDMHSEGTQRIGDISRLKEYQYSEDAGTMSHPIQPDSYVEMNNFYTSTVYEKGSEVIRMMATMLGKEKFRKAMDLYFETFDGQAVTTSDFVWAMSTGGERDLTQFEDSWYHQPRTPHITVTESYDSETQEYTLTVVQNSQKDQEGNTLKPWYFPLGIALFDRESHEQYPLDIADTKQDLIDRDMLIISRMQEVFVFRGITSKPVLSINRGFTSPVRVTMEEQDTLFLMQHETNPIARYQAAQESAREAIKSLLGGGDVNPEYIRAYQTIFREDISDRLFHASLISIPSTASLISEIAGSDPIVLDRARDTLLQSIGRDESLALLHDTLRESISLIIAGDEGISDDEIAARAYIISQSILLTEFGRDTRDIAELLIQSKNMTLILAGYKILLRLDTITNLFRLDTWMQEHKYFDDVLMKVKYFGLVSSIRHVSIVDIITKMIHSSHFDYKIPNLVRALIGGFGKNIGMLHTADGSGYDFFLEQLSIIDDINPQISSRIAGLLSNTNLLDTATRDRIQTRVRVFLSRDGLSSEIREILEKIL